jgi:hypothetical protein
MLDLAIVLALVVLNALAHSAYVQWRKTPKVRGVRHSLTRNGLAYPTHPSPSLAAVPEHAAIRPIGIDW